MANYGNKEFSKPQVIGANETDVVVSDIQLISCDDSLTSTFTIEASSVTSASGITLQLQESHRKDATYVDVSGASVAITGNGSFDIVFNEVDGANRALKPFIRMVITTGAGDAVTVDRIYRTTRL